MIERKKAREHDKQVKQCQKVLLIKIWIKSVPTCSSVVLHRDIGHCTI